MTRTSELAEYESGIFLAEPAEVELSGGRKIAVPRWSARKALALGGKIAALVSAAGATSDAARRDALETALPMLGEIVCQTLDCDDSLLDSINKDDLLEIALAIIRQEFLSPEFRALSKKAAALLPVRD